MKTQTIVALASAVIALAALAFSIFSFQRQQRRTERFETKKVKPLLWIRSETYTDQKSIQLWNYGLGPAIITSAQFEKGDRRTHKIVELFDGINRIARSPAGHVKWVRFVGLLPNRAIPAQDHITLVEQSLENLQSQGVDEAAGLELLRLWMDAKTDIKVSIEYADIFGNTMKTFKETLH
jgi:hypothetical protein